jgi:hypothetical protein
VTFGGLSANLLEAARRRKPPGPLRKVIARCVLVEGLNNKVKLTFKRAHGFRIADAREVALFHALGKLPEPQFTTVCFRQGDVFTLRVR